MGIAVNYAIPKPKNNEFINTRLCQSFEKGLTRRVIFACAPIGFGKTTFLSQRARVLSQKEAWYVAWLNLCCEHSSQTPFNLFRALGNALTEADKSVFSEPISTSMSNEQPGFSQWDEVLHHLSNIPGRIVIFIDGLENLTDRDSVEALNYVISSVPEKMTLVVSGRANPGIALFRAKTDSVLLELGGADFELTEAEITHFFNSCGTNVGINHEEAAELRKRTCGWMMGVRAIAVLAQQLGGLRAVLGASRELSDWVKDFLVNGAFPHLSQETLQFALKTCLVEEFDERLCAVFAEEEHRTDILKELTVQNLLVKKTIGINGEYRTQYRYHPLLLDELKRQARAALSDEVLYRVAFSSIEWHKTHGSYELAIAASFVIEDYDQALEIIIDNLYVILPKEGSETLAQWLAAIPYPSGKNEYIYCLLCAWTAFTGGKTKRARSFLAKAEQAKDPIDNTSWRGTENIFYAVKVGTLVFSGSYQDAVVMGLSSLDKLGGPQLFLRCTIMHNLGEAFERLGQFSEAYECFARARIDASLSKRRVIELLCSGEMAFIHCERGSLEASTNLAMRSLATCSKEELDESWAVGLLQVSMARAYFYWGDSEKSKEWLNLAFKRLNPTVNRDGFIEARTLLACVSMLEGFYDEAFDTLLEVYELLHIDKVPRGVDLFSMYTAIDCLLGLGKIKQAKSVVDELTEAIDANDLYTRLALEYFKARILCEENALEQAATVFESAYAQAQKAEFALLALKIKVHFACVLRMLDEVGRAKNIMAEALLEAADESILSVFERNIPFLSALVYEIGFSTDDTTLQSKDRSKAQCFARAVMDNRNSRIQNEESGNKDDVSSLSTREKQVYTLLKQGKTRKEIAAELDIKVNTVRTHVRSIYRKLDIHNRSLL